MASQCHTMADGIRRSRLCTVLRVCVFSSLCVLTSGATHAQTWWESRSGDFHVVSRLRRDETVRIARDIEIYQIALASFFPIGDIHPHVPVTVLVLDASLWKKYVTNQRDRAGFAYTRNDRVDVVANGDNWVGASPLVYHELTHVFLHKNFSGSALPVWFDEGYADFMSTVDAGVDHVRVGLVPAWRYISMHELPWMPLQTLLAVSRDSPQYNSEKLAAAFYAQSWLIIHYQLFANPERRKQIDRYLSSLGVGNAPQQAFATAFANDQGEFEQELKRYANQTDFKYVAFDIPDVRKKIEAHVSELSASDAAEELGGWMIRNSSLNDASMQFLESQASHAAPASIASLQLAIAYLRKKDKPDSVKSRLDAACTPPVASWRAAMLCGDGELMLAAADTSSADESRKEDLMRRAQRSFSRALELAPDSIEVPLHAADAYRGYGSESAALRGALEKALVRDPRNPEIAESLAALFQDVDPAKTRTYLERAVLNVFDAQHLQYLFEWLRSVEAQIAATKAAASIAPPVR